MRPESLLLLVGAVAIAAAPPGPFDGKSFRGRIAWSADGNHNDEDDWAASPTPLAIFAAAGVKDRLVHFDYNNILTSTNPEWEREHEISIRGAIERFGYNPRIFHDCRKNVHAAVDSIARAINASSAADPLYFILAGPMEVPYLGIMKSNPAKRRFVSCISHSRWNDGFARHYIFSYNKRAVIPTGIRWVQIADQNAGLSTGPFGRRHTAEEWAPWLWMRDSPVEPVRFLWDRLRATGRADCSDAGMAYFLVTGDESADIAKLRDMLEKGVRPRVIDPRPRVRLEAENALTLEQFDLEANDRGASHQLHVKLVAGAKRGRLIVPFDQPYTAHRGRYEIQVHYRSEGAASCHYELSVAGLRRGAPWEAPAEVGWRVHAISGVPVSAGEQLAVTAECGSGGTAHLDFVELWLNR